MSASLAARVNQRLAQARTLLGDLQRVEDTGEPALRQTALLDACVFHCYCGLTQYVREICQYYGIRDLASVDSLSSGRTLLAQQGKGAAELNELWHLQQQPDSWLAALVAHYQACWALPHMVGEEKRDEDRIAVIDLDAAKPAALTAQSLSEAIDHFGRIIERQRESTTEY